MPRARRRRVLLVVVLAVATAVIVLGLGLVALSRVSVFESDDLGVVPCTHGRVGSVHFTDGPAPITHPEVFAAPGRWAVVDEFVSDVVLAGLDTPAPTSLSIAQADGVALSPDGSYLILERSDLPLLVVRLADRRVIAEVSGPATRYVFAGPSRLVVFVTSNECRFGRVLDVDLAARTVRRVAMRGLRAGVAPVGVIANQVIVDRVVDGGGQVRADEYGVSVLDLDAGRARNLNDAGQAVAVVSSPPRVWVSSTDALTVMDLDGRITGTATLPIRAAALPNGLVAYIEPATSVDCIDSNAQSSLRLGAADGPQPNDPAVSIPCIPAPGDLVFTAKTRYLAASDDGTTLLVVAPVPSPQVELLACSVPELVCRELGPNSNYVYASVRGVLTTPPPPPAP